VIHYADMNNRFTACGRDTFYADWSHHWADVTCKTCAKPKTERASSRGEREGRDG
jgi:hypothetical protein